MDTQVSRTYVWLAVAAAVAAVKLGKDFFEGYRRRSLMPPGPKGIPILGNLLEVMGSRPMRLLFTEWKQQFGMCSFFLYLMPTSSFSLTQSIRSHLLS